MPTFGGRGIHGKIIKVKPYDNEGDDKLLWLTERQRGLLLAFTEYLDWRSRWETLPSPLDDDDERDAYVSGLKNRLMIVVEFCAEVIDCIENDEDTKNVLRSFINTSLGNQPGAPGENLPDNILNNNIAGNTNPTCNYDILFAQCREVVQQTHLAVLDVLQKVEVTTNVVEFVNSLATAIPVITTLYDESGIDGVVQLFNYYQEAILEQYEAQFTETVGGVFDELSYGLFCYCSNDCTININKVVDFYKSRLSVYTSVPSFEGLVNLVEFLFGINQDTTFVVDLAHFAAWAMIKFGNFLFGKYYSQTLEIIIQLKSDEPSNDWEALQLVFGDCPNEYCYIEDLAITNGDYTVISGSQNGSWTITEGWNVGCNGSTCIKQLFIEQSLATDERLTSIELTWDAVASILPPDSSSKIVRIRGFNSGGGQVFSVQQNITYGTNQTFNWQGDAVLRKIEILLIPVNFAAACDCMSLDGSGVLKSIKYNGIGTNPFGTDNC